MYYYLKTYYIILFQYYYNYVNVFICHYTLLLLYVLQSIFNFKYFTVLGIQVYFTINIKKEIFQSFKKINNTNKVKYYVQLKILNSLILSLSVV